MGIYDMSEISPVVKELRNSVLYLRINRPAEDNRIDDACGEMLAEALGEAVSDSTLRAVVITGTGTCFHTGFRFTQGDYGTKIQKLCEERLSQISVPVVCAVNGDCFSDGMSLLLQSDLAVATESACFAYPEILQNSFPIMAMLTAMDHIPKKKALAAFYTGDPFTAQEALSMSLINQVVSEEELWHAVEAMVSKIADKPEELISIGRRAYNKLAELPQSQRREYGMTVLPEILAAQAKYEKK